MLQSIRSLTKGADTVEQPAGADVPVEQPADAVTAKGFIALSVERAAGADVADVAAGQPVIGKDTN